MRQELCLSITDPSRVGEGRRNATQLARDLGFSEDSAGKIAIVATELASNLIKHGTRGQLIFQIFEYANQSAGLDLIALDHGPGISDIAEALRDGSSSSGSAGIGLGAMARLSDHFDIHSVRETGTGILCRFFKDEKRPGLNDIEFGGICVPMPGQAVAGDSWTAISDRNAMRLLVVDGLGHGPLAAQAAHEAVRVFQSTSGGTPSQSLNSIHIALRSTRGAAAAIADFDLNRKQIRYVGVGNISGILLYRTGGQRNLVSHNGTLGHEPCRINEFEYPLPEGTIVILHSDGLSTHWNLNKYSGLMSRHPALIAGVIFRDFGKMRDDTTVVVSKVGSV